MTTIFRVLLDPKNYIKRTVPFFFLAIKVHRRNKEIKNFGTVKTEAEADALHAEAQCWIDSYGSVHLSYVRRFSVVGIGGLRTARAKPPKIDYS